MQRRIALTRPLDLRRTLQVLSRGDDTVRLGDSDAWRATRTPEGPATIHLIHDADEVCCEAWGPGAEWALEYAPELIGELDDSGDFVPRDNLVRGLHARYAGLRFPRSRAVFEAMVPAVLEQKVVSADARASLRQLVRKLGEPAPGDSALLLPVAAETLAAAGYDLLHRCNVERRRAEVLRHVAKRAGRLDECVSMPLADAYSRMTSISGIGPWTAAVVAASALGDADAVPVGDYHLPNMVAWALAGEPRADDDRMLELLEPYRPHRGRVIRYLAISGNHAPRRGPRMPRHNFSRR